ncbi:hypothetical protein SAMN05216374_4236 [Tardiphaga sp. OK246]|uniref:hypothetical protein n=1 Tax=Tardiphaga sp. OK246 TaxID=1855307 RepID=UPI000B626AF8|nr:hypothetical protein [Tardiphaga sp. OK246]SNT49750.1 hypothetical protein SAMN05216374_4236 [Tardiphaga sp. OK246]
MTDATMTTALVRFKAEHGHISMRELLERVSGARTASDVPADRVMAVIKACNEGCSGGDNRRKAKAPLDFRDESFVAGIYSRWNGV